MNTSRPIDFLLRSKLWRRLIEHLAPWSSFFGMHLRWSFLHCSTCETANTEYWLADYSHWVSLWLRYSNIILHSDPSLLKYWLPQLSLRLPRLGSSQRWLRGTMKDWTQCFTAVDFHANRFSVAYSRYYAVNKSTICAFLGWFLVNFILCWSHGSRYSRLRRNSKLMDEPDAQPFWSTLEAILRRTQLLLLLLLLLVTCYLLAILCPAPVPCQSFQIKIPLWEDWAFDSTAWKCLWRFGRQGEGQVLMQTISAEIIAHAD